VDLGPLTKDTSLTVTASIVDGKLTSKFSGSAELPEVAAMNGVVAQLHSEAVAKNIRDVVVDFTALEFMNSSCFKSLVTWINDVVELPAHARYRINFRSNPELLWQRRSLHVLKTFATERVALATHELLENAVRYAADDETRLRIEVAKDDDQSPTRVTVSTSNRAAPEDLQVVRSMFDEMLAEPDPFAFYQTLMRRTAKRDDGSGLGLARIRAEADMSLTYDVRGETLSVHAATEVSSP